MGSPHLPTPALPRLGACDDVTHATSRVPTSRAFVSAEHATLPVYDRMYLALVPWRRPSPAPPCVCSRGSGCGASSGALGL